MDSIDITSARNRVGSVRAASQQYIEAIKAHSELTVQKTILAGPHYREFASWLSKSPLQTDHEHTHPATLHDLNQERRASEAVHHFHNVQGLTQCLKHMKDSPTPQAMVLFLKGYLTQDWVSHVGALCNIDPEFWLRHFRVRPSANEPQYHTASVLPSSASNIIRLRIPNIGYRAKQDVQDQAQIEHLRSTAQSDFSSYLNEIKNGNTIKPGDSIVRDYIFHDSQHFSIHQDLHICTNKFGLGWIIVVWSDFGAGLSNGPRGPWSPPVSGGRDWATVISPTVLHRPGIALKTRNQTNPHIAVPKDEHLQQSGTALAANYGRWHDQKAAAQDPFYALNDILNYKAAAELQFLNLLDEKITQQVTRTANVINLDILMNSWTTVWRNFSQGQDRDQYGGVLAREEQYAAASSNLLHYKNILDDRIRALRENIIFLENDRGNRRPDGASGDLLTTIKAANTSQLVDFRCLLNMAETLRDTCDRGFDITCTNAMIHESRVAVAQARQITKLTNLATCFIPAAFTTGLFGMNIVELGQGSLSIWVWLLVLASTYLLVVLFLYSDARLRKSQPILPITEPHRHEHLFSRSRLRQYMRRS